MARYRKVDVRIWVDDKFRRLTPLPPGGQALWLYLITNPNTTNIPGLYRSGELAMAEELGWPPARFRAIFAEVTALGMVEADWGARVVFLPKAVHYDPPESPNVVASWRSSLDEIPECPLKARAVTALRDHLERMGPSWVAAFDLASELSRDRRRAPDEATRTSVKQRDGDRCRYCDRAVKWTDRRGPAGATLDHVDPTGPSNAENLVVACRGCNSFKGFRRPEQAGMQLRPESGSKSPSKSDLSPVQPKPINPDPDQEPEPDPEREHARPDLGIGGTGVLPPPLPSNPANGITAYDLTQRFGIAWRQRYNQPWAPDRETSAAARDLLENMIGRMPEADDRAAALEDVMPALARYLADTSPSLLKNRHPFPWFVDRFNQYRVAEGAAAAQQVFSRPRWTGPVGGDAQPLEVKPMPPRPTPQPSRPRLMKP